ncbi:MAG: sulfatase-like hydrolase/transferase [Fibrobacter sp.]|nr:sulfatase-like hydrolase/transferase [Fibrobacter sp.]
MDFLEIKKRFSLLKKTDFSFIVFWLVTYITRLFQLLHLYFSDTPSGGPFVERPWSGFICAAIADLAAFSISGIIFALASFRHDKTSKVIRVTISIVILFYLIFCGVNDQIMRWMGQHITLSFLSTYSVSKLEPNLVSNIISTGLWNFVLAILIVVTATIFWIAYQKKVTPINSSKALLCSFIIFLSIFTFVSWNANDFFKPCHIRWQRIQPPYITIFDELEYQKQHSVKPSNYAEGITLLGGDTNEDFPFYHKVENELAFMKEFMEKPLSEKKDVILLSLESFRGWVGDFRIEQNCNRMPNLCKLGKRGTLFPYTYSVGYPSTEGMLGLQLGIWSHPNKIFLSSLQHVRAKALPEILGEAGYHRIVLTAAEPSFDNFTPWFEKWFDVSEYNPDINTDIPLAKRFIEMYENRPLDKPLYFEWINFVTHTPFNVPKSYATPAATSDERYEQAVAYLDSAIGIILNCIEKSPRVNETIIIVTGDHSIANGKAQKKLDELGETNSTYTWTTFIWAGTGIPEGLSITKPVSHIDFAPTVLSLLGIRASNNFVGHNLFAEEFHPTFSFRHNDAIMRNNEFAIFARFQDSSFTHARIQSHIVDWDTTETIGGFIAEQKAEGNFTAEAKALIDAMDAWAWVLDKGILAP